MKVPYYGEKRGWVVEGVCMGFISEEQMLRVLFGLNPWWRTGVAPKDLARPVKRAAFYEARRFLQVEPIRRVVVLSGARRVGKTTIMYQMIEDLLATGVSSKSVLYVTFDHPLLKFFNIGQIVDVFRGSIAPAADGNVYLFFDEVQYASDWNNWLKVLHDQMPGARIMATGSASPVLAAKSSESGVGRWTMVHVPTLSFFEYVQIAGVEGVPDLPTGFELASVWKADTQGLAALVRPLYGLESHFRRYLLIGGFPEFVAVDDVSLAQRVLREDVVDKVLKRDMTAVFGIRSVAELEKVFLYLCLHSGSIVAFDAIANAVGISRHTVANFVELLKAANLIYVSNPVEAGGKKVLRSRPKIYLADAALRNAVLILGEDLLADAEGMGMVVETAVYKHLYTYYSPLVPKVGYYRDARSDREIDVVVSLPTGRLLVEVKYRDATPVNRHDAIVSVANEKETSGAVVVTKRFDDYGVLGGGSRVPIVKIPAFAFLYMVGSAERWGRAGS